MNTKKPYHKQIKPTIPKLNTLPNTNKRIPITPLVNYTTAPPYKLAKYMDHLIRSNIKLKNHIAIKISIEFIYDIKEKHISHNATLAPFDLKNLYTNFQTSETLQILVNMLKQNNIPQSHIDEIINITTIVTQQNNIFNNKYYTQPEGLPMDSMISSILAEIFIHYIEQTHILNEQNNKYAHKIIYWYRYVIGYRF